MIILRDISLRRGERLLFAHSSATLQAGQRIALIGANGSGKSSLFAMLLGELAPDAGEIEGMGDLRIAHMAQEVVTAHTSAARYVLEGDREVARLLQLVQQQEEAEDFTAAAATHLALHEVDGYTAESRCHRLLRGLGFQAEDADRPVAAFSGGWRIRLNLARALMTPSDILLLDEPTNHLDMDASLWLQRWLAGYPGTLVLVSHDRDFIDASCERVLHIEHQQLHSYRGGYSDFETQRAERLANQQALHERQQRRVAQIEDFVRRFRYKATKAKQAQSRLKELERMQLVAAAHLDSPFEFNFPEPAPLSDPALELENAELGYAGRSLLHRVNVRLHPGARVGLLGRNGAGKTTLLKSLIGDLPLLAGRRHASAGCRIGYYDQQQLDVLDLQASPALHLQRLRPEAREQEIFDFLGGFDFRGPRAGQPIAPFSGGEKARLALAMVVWQQPNLLVLDEPTNHLDLDMREALALALTGFSGAMVLVTHDRHLLRNTTEELWLVADGGVSEYEGDVASYERSVLSSAADDAPPAAAARSTAATPAAGDRRQTRQKAAERRQALKPLQQSIRKLEAQLYATQASLATVQQQLTEQSIYRDTASNEVSVLLREEGELRSRAADLEERWLQAQEQLELLSAG